GFFITSQWAAPQALTQARRNHRLLWKLGKFDLNCLSNSSRRPRQELHPRRIMTSGTRRSLLALKCKPPAQTFSPHAKPMNHARADPDTGPPANDKFAASTHLSGAIVLAEGRTTDSTPESGEPKLSPQSMGHTVWWTWSSPEKSNVYISGRSATQNPNNYHY